MTRYDPLKRTLDILVGSAALLATAPLQLLVAAAVRTKLGSPVLFRQDRPGRGGKTFQLVKFRTMLDVDASKNLVSDEQRLTRFGAMLRATSLDELPSLWNIVKGDMSFVGPRPLRTHYLPLYSPEQARRHEVRPGLTGLAQVSGRNLVAWEDRFALDVWYVDNQSLTTDARIVLRTISSVLSRRGITAEGHVTMMPFEGTKTDVI